MSRFKFVHILVSVVSGVVALGMFAPSAICAPNAIGNNDEQASVSSPSDPSPGNETSQVSSQTGSQIVVDSRNAQRQGSASVAGSQSIRGSLNDKSAVLQPVSQPNPQQNGGSSVSDLGKASSGNSSAKQADGGSKAGVPLVRGGTIVSHDVATAADNITVTGLSLDSMHTGQAPFDSDDNPGDDSSASNAIVRSFDKVTYDYDYTLTPQSPMDYYRDAHVRFDVHIPVDKNKAVLDTNDMNWIDRNPQYPSTHTDNPDGSQDYVFWRHTTASRPGTYVAPGTATVTIVLKINVMLNGQTLTPSVNARSEYTGDTVGKTDTPRTLTISAKTSLDIRIGNFAGDSTVTQASPIRKFDFDKPEAAGQINYGLGKKRGYITGMPWAVDLRWPNADIVRGKGMKGLEAPQGPITFNLSTTDKWNKDNGDVADDGADVQSRFWGLAPVTTPTMSHADAAAQQATPSTPGRELNNDTQNYVPRSDNYKIAGGFRTHTDNSDHNRTYDNGDYQVTQEIGSDYSAYHFTLSGYDIGPFWPKQGSSPQAGATCSSEFMDDGCTVQNVGEISTGYLYLFHPVDKTDSQLQAAYGSGVTVTLHADEGGMSYTDVSGVASNTSGSDRSNQAVNDHNTDGSTVNNDNWRPDRFSLVVPGSVSPFYAYGCATDRAYEENGLDCAGWTGDDNRKDTDVATPGDPIRISATYVFQQPDAKLPVGHMMLIKIDPTVIDLADENHLDAGGSGGSGGDAGKTGFFHSWNDPDPFFNRATPVKAKYAVKPNGLGWTNDTEERTAVLGDLRYYNSKAEAQSHGTIVGVLLASNQPAYSRSAGIETKFSMGNIRATVRRDAPDGSVAQLSAISYMYTRQQMKTAKGLSLSVEGQDSDWADWTMTQNPMDWYFNDHLQGAVDTDIFQRKPYVKPSYTAAGYLAGSGTHERQWGDALYVAGEQPAVDISVAQRSGGNPKSEFDLDNRQRTVDWAIGARIRSISGRGTSNAVVTATLPVGLHYLANSSKLDGIYTEHTPDAGTVIGGTDFEPSVTNNPNGTTTLVWHVPDIPRDSRDRTIHFSTTIGNEDDSSHDAKNNDHFTVSASISSDGYHVSPNNAKGTLSSASMGVSKLREAGLATRAKTLINEIGHPFVYRSMFGNYSQSSKADPFSVEIMPHHGGNDSLSTFHGTYQIQSVRIKAQGSASLSGLVVRYSTDTSLQGAGVSPADITRMQIDTHADIWKTADVVPDGADDLVRIDFSRSFTMPSRGVTAMAFELPTLPAGSSLLIDTTLKPRNNKAGDFYEQQWADGANNVIALTQTCNRIVSGTVWYDSNQNGLNDPGEPVVPNASVKLVDGSGRIVTDTGGHPLQGVTDSHGNYRFDDVSSGSGYRVRVNGPRGLTPTTAHVGGDRTINSKADEHGSIAIAGIPSLARMVSPTYEDDYENEGLVGPLDAGETGFVVVKRLLGRDWLPGEQYRFNIAPIGGAPAAGEGQAVPSSVRVGGLGSAAGRKTVLVDASKFTLPSPAHYTFRYKITEDSTDHHARVTPAPGTPTEYVLTIVTYDDYVDFTRHVTATLSDASGASVRTATFTNKYTPASSGLGIGGHESSVPGPGNGNGHTPGVPGPGSGSGNGGTHGLGSGNGNGNGGGAMPSKPVLGSANGPVSLNPVRRNGASARLRPMKKTLAKTGTETSVIVTVALLTAALGILICWLKRSRYNARQ